MSAWSWNPVQSTFRTESRFVCVSIGLCVCAHRDVLIGVVHHGDEHVQEHHQWNDVVGSEHGGAHKLGELVVGVHVGDVEADQAEDRPEERLQGLKQPAGETHGYSVFINLEKETPSPWCLWNSSETSVSLGNWKPFTHLQNALFTGTHLSVSLPPSFTTSHVYTEHAGKDEIHVNSRGEGVILLHTADALTFPLLVRSLGLVVEVELVQPVSEGQQDLQRDGVCMSQSTPLSHVQCVDVWVFACLPDSRWRGTSGCPAAFSPERSAAAPGASWLWTARSGAGSWKC